MSDDGYNDEFSDGEGHFTSDYPATDFQDEQHAQKVNGMIETLQLRVEELQNELASEKEKWEEFQKDKSGEKTAAELDKYKSMCERLKERLEIVMSENSTQLCPPALRMEFVSFCKRNKIFVNLNEQDMNEENCIKILSTKLNSPPVKGGSDLKLSIDSQASDAGGDQPLILRIRDLEKELRLALGAAEDIRALKAKLLQMVERNRQEKEMRLRTEVELQHSRKKVDMLSDHMEKLMVHLKHEAASKIRVVEQLRTSEKENNRIKDKCDLVVRKGVAKDRLILELREGSKVLEDQLRLMDEKFLELRTKLDWARETGAKKIRKAELKAKELRAKFALAGNLTLLDNVQLPDIRAGSGGGYESSTGGSGLEGDAHMATWSAKGKRLGATSKSTNNLHRTSVSSGHSEISDLDGFKKPEPSIASVLDKIRKQQGAKQEWTDEKLKQLTQKKL